jgi:hypothetical protein
MFNRIQNKKGNGIFPIWWHWNTNIISFGEEKFNIINQNPDITTLINSLVKRIKKCPIKKTQDDPNGKRRTTFLKLKSCYSGKNAEIINNYRYHEWNTVEIDGKKIQLSEFPLSIRTSSSENASSYKMVWDTRITVAKQLKKEWKKLTRKLLYERIESVNYLLSEAWSMRSSISNGVSYINGKRLD